LLRKGSEAPAPLPVLLPAFPVSSFRYSSFILSFFLADYCGRFSIFHNKKRLLS
jgi:hypothetical protein